MECKILITFLKTNKAFFSNSTFEFDIDSSDLRGLALTKILP